MGDTVTWNFTGPAEHTATSNPGQPEKFDSGLKDEGGTFTHTFTKPGKYQYFCRPHEEFMKGTVTVGKDAVAKSFTSAKVKGAASSIKLTVTLKETAKVTLSVKGTKKKSVSKRLKAGQAHAHGQEAEGGQLQDDRHRSGRLRQEDHEEGQRDCRLTC